MIARFAAVGGARTLDGSSSEIPTRRCLHADSFSDSAEFRREGTLARRLMLGLVGNRPVGAFDEATIGKFVEPIVRNSHMAGLVRQQRVISC